MYFSPDAEAELELGVLAASKKQQDLMLRYLQHNFQSDRAREFAHNGVSRRLATMEYCIRSVFNIIPPNGSPLGKDERHDATAKIQSFLINTFGAIDNLAWMWVEETGLAQRVSLRPKQIGLSSNHRLVVGSLPQALQNHVAGLKDWWIAMEGYRHALAHRIPLYIPPHVVFNKNVEEYRQLESSKNAALAAGNVPLYRKLDAKQEELTQFRPMMQHSFGEGAIPMVFHAQLIADFGTVHELAELILAALPER